MTMSEEIIMNATMHCMRLLLFIAYRVGSGKDDAAALAHERKAYNALMDAYLRETELPLEGSVHKASKRDS